MMCHRSPSKQFSTIVFVERHLYLVFILMFLNHIRWLRLRWLSDYYDYRKKYCPQSFKFCFKNTLYSFVINAENKTLTIFLAWRLWITFAIPLLDHYTTCSSLDSGSTFTLSLLLNYPFRFQSWINFNLFTLVF